MSVLIRAMDVFWHVVALSDNKRHAKQTEPTGVKRVCDLAYLPDGNRYHLLDVYYPENVTGKLPVIIDVHGGGWMYADKELNKMYCLNLAKRGFVVFNISYRLVPEVTVPMQIQDVMAALSWIEAHRGDFPATEQTMLTGDSAGGMLAAYAAVLLSNPALRHTFRTADCAMPLDCLLLTSPVAYMDENNAQGVYTRQMWGSRKQVEAWRRYMNLDRILDNAKLPPTVMVTSSGDFMALKQTRRAAADLRKRGVDVYLMDFPKYDGKDLPHVFSVLEPASKAGVEVIENAIRFYRQTLAETVG